MVAEKDCAGTAVGTNGHDVRRALDWVVKDDSSFTDIKLHGNVSWKAVDIVRLAILWAISPAPTMVESVESAVASMFKLFAHVPVKTYQGLTGALKKYSPELLSVMWNKLHRKMEIDLGVKHRIGIFLALAVDGSTVSVPRTAPNEQRFCKLRQSEKKKKKKKKKNTRTRHANRRRSDVARVKSHYNPQSPGPLMWLTLIWHIGLQVPWAWKIGPGYSSEREHFLEMLKTFDFPGNTLFCMDAGFYGYDFWNEIIANGHHFLIRVGGNVRLLKKLGYTRESQGIVYCWPDSAARKGRPPLVLRLLRFHDGYGEIYLVTNILGSKELTEKMAGEIYRKRWGIELQFRSLKQTYNRTKLRARTPDCAVVELNWSLMALTILQLLAAKEQTKLTEPDVKTSVATALRIVRQMIHHCSEQRPRARSLNRQLAEATTDTYDRPSKKKSRNFPRRKSEPSAKAPIVVNATSAQRRKCKNINQLLRAAA